MNDKFDELIKSMAQSVTRRAALTPPRRGALGLAGPALAWFLAACSVAGASQAPPASSKTEPIPMGQLGAFAGKQYHGDGLSVVATSEGARLRCAFQRLEGQATPEGLWLISTVRKDLSERFRVVAAAVGRGPSAAASHNHTEAKEENKATGRNCEAGAPVALTKAGRVEVTGQVVRWLRPGLTEEYCVSMDGVRQDFLVVQRPGGAGPLRLELEAAGAKVEQMPNGAQLVLDGSGRRIAYSRLRVTDATGKELPARMEVESNPERRTQKAEMSQSLLTSAATLVVVVNDADAVYPVRIDPTFSDANWFSLGGVPGAYGTVYAAVVDGSGNLYVGGEFTLAGDVFANHVAKWNGTSWSALGSGMSDRVSALAVSGSDVYAGGNFTNAGGSAANYVAKWDGTNWSALGSGISGGDIYGRVAALAVLGSDLYAGGDFTTAGGGAANYVAKWDGTNWSALGSGIGGGSFYGPYVAALAVLGSDLYAGGDFTTAGGSPANGIAKWNGSSWSALGSGISGPPDFPYYGGQVNALAVSGNDLFVGGYFTTAGGSPANSIAKWDGSSWSALGSGMSGAYPIVLALAVSGSELYAGGYFTGAGNIIRANGIAKWDGSSWSALGSGMEQPVQALAVSGSALYAGGNFTTAGGSPAIGIAQWSGSSWSALGSGMNDWVNALAVSGGELYAGGHFTRAGGSLAYYIAKWNGSGWSAVGAGMNSDVLALAVSGSDLYVGGVFTTATNSDGAAVAVNGIAKWNGSSWSALGSGVDGLVKVLVVSGGNVYAGGSFTTAGGSAANNIAKWNGSIWSPLGMGTDYGTVWALALSGSNLYVGGTFTTGINSDGSTVTVNYVAKWDGNSWSALGSGMNDMVQALAVSGSDLYAGGDFTTAGGVAVYSIAKWDGSSWSALGLGIDAPFVAALVASGHDVYAGGYFTTLTNTDGAAVTVNQIAKWDGNSWSALGSGMNEPVYALAVSGGDLYAGGGFTRAGGKVSGFVARAVVGEPDEDNDGVPDSLDQCPGTAPGAIVNADGCSLEQLVPCAGPWKNHGQYVSAVAHASEVFLKQGLITEQQQEDIISAAARSDCGKTKKPRR